MWVSTDSSLQIFFPLWPRNCGRCSFGDPVKLILANVNLSRPWPLCAFGGNWQSARFVRFYKRSPPPSSAFFSVSPDFRALPDLNCELKISLGAAGSRRGPRSQWALPDLNCNRPIAVGNAYRELQIAVGTAGLEPRAPDPSGHCRTSTASSRSQWARPHQNSK
eukprot:s551_g5.t1